MGKKKKAIAIKKPRPGVEAKSTKKTLVQIHNTKRLTPTV